MSKIQGVVPAKVDSAPDELGRVRVRINWLGGENRSYWAPVATLMSGRGRGSWFMPEIGDDVLLAFDQGNPELPYIIGHLWNGEDNPPTTDRQMRVIHSVNGHKIEIYDPAVDSGDTGYVSLSDAHGNEIRLANASITIRGVGLIQINAPSVVINGRPVAVAAAPI
jgi:uncharacterized protein involved in type VI secretion and phage assembly